MSSQISIELSNYTIGINERVAYDTQIVILPKLITLITQTMNYEKRISSAKSLPQ